MKGDGDEVARQMSQATGIDLVFCPQHGIVKPPCGQCAANVQPGQSVFCEATKMIVKCQRSLFTSSGPQRLLFYSQDRRWLWEGDINAEWAAAWSEVADNRFLRRSNGLTGAIRRPLSSGYIFRIGRDERRSLRFH
jgi:hypothetical protein